MKILYVTSEAVPFVSTGGLGDVSNALPKAIKSQDEEISISVILPFYDVISASHQKQLTKLTDISFYLSWRKTHAEIYTLNHGGVDYYFVKNDYYFKRGRLYGEYDDGERFAFFSMAVLEFILTSKNTPNIIHANDWQSALSVIYLKTKYKDNAELEKIKTVYTIHNIEYQGKYDLAILRDVFDIDNKYTHTVEHNGCINLMKGAITLADFVTTVSPNYANELKYDFFAVGLADVIRKNEYKLIGIINGIDYSDYSPLNADDLYFPYTKRAYLSGKSKNKAALQRELGLSENREVPLIAMITRLSEEKGIDLVLRIGEELLSENIQLVILGTGNAYYEEAIRSLGERHKNLIALIRFDRALAKKIYAAADIFLMPSKSEPCGLAQMIACSYGTVPIVRSVGGLYDSIEPYTNNDGCGFRFDNYNAHDLLYTVKDAIKLYHSKAEWASLVKRALKKDFSWNNSALEYISIYKNILF